MISHKLRQLFSNLLGLKLFNILKIIIKKIILFSKFFLIFIYLPFALVLFIFDFKIVKVVSDRIGHLIHDIEIEVK